MAGPDRRLDPRSEPRTDPWQRWGSALAAEPGRHTFSDVLDLLARLVPRVDLRHGASLGFARGELESVALVEDDDGRRSATVTAAFFGLAGETTPMPLRLAEEADREDDHGAAVRGLLDVFHQRLLALLHMALSLEHPRSFRADGKDPWTRAVLGLLGLSERAGSLAPAELLRLAPILAHGVRSPEMLVAGLRVALGPWLGEAAIACEPFTGEWMEIDRAEQSRLGGEQTAMGITTTLGTAILHRAGAARITIGPLTGEAYRAFTPGGPAHARLRELTDTFLPAPIRLELTLDVEDMSYPPGRLGERRLAGDLWLARSTGAGLTTKIRVALDEEAPR